MCNEDELSLLATANQFYEAAKIVHDAKFKPSTIIPRCYLFSHSIELSYKSYLLHNGIPLRDLIQKYGHDLEKALDKAMTYEFLKNTNNPNDHIRVIKCLNQYYCKKEFEYLSLRKKSLPFIEDVDRVAKEALCIAFDGIDTSQSIPVLKDTSR